MTATPDLALYVGSMGHVLVDGTPLVPNETVIAVPAGEAHASEQWTPCDENGKPLKRKRKGGEQ